MIKQDTKKNRHSLRKCLFFVTHMGPYWPSWEIAHFLSLTWAWGPDLLGNMIIFRDSHGVPTDLFEKVLISRDSQGAPTNLLVEVLTPYLNEKIDSGNTHLQDLAQWWRTSQGVDIPKISQFYWGLFEKTRFLWFYIINSNKKRAKIPLNLTSEGLKYPPEVRVHYDTCSTICGTHVQAILNQKILTGLVGGVRESQNRSKYCPE